MVMREPAEFNCRECKHHHCDETGEIEGSRGRGNKRWRINGEVYRTCPLPMVTEFSREMLRYHVHYRNHYLPMPDRSFLDQPAGFLRAMEIIESVPVSSSGDR